MPQEEDDEDDGERQDRHLPLPEPALFGGGSNPAEPEKADAPAAGRTAAKGRKSATRSASFWTTTAST